jgi:hypothetical protein
VLSQNAFGIEYAVVADTSLRNAAATFFEQIGENAFVDDRNACRGIRNDKMNGQSIRIAF